MQQSTKTLPLDSTFEIEGLTQFLLRNGDIAWGKFCEEESPNRQAIYALLVEEVRHRLATLGGVVETLQEERSGLTAGLVIAEQSTWDSEHFGFPMGKIALGVFDDEITVESRAKTIARAWGRIATRMLSARVNLTDILTVQALEKLGGTLTDILSTFRFDLGSIPPLVIGSGLEIGPSREGEIEDLARMGGSIFTVDRFHNDPRLPVSKSNELYSKWVRNSAKGLADVVLVAREGSEIVGFITCKIDRIGQAYKSGVIDLVGVHPSYSGLGIGKKLVFSALKWFTGRVPIVFVGTQAANSRAVRLYEGTGFSHVCSDATLHLWADPIN